MTGLKVLALDTSTECCSAALLWHTGEIRLRCKMLERGHAEVILPMIDELLAEAGCQLSDLNGLAFGRGPGGFTGLRIAAGVVQGLAFGAGLKVAPVSSLAAVAFLTSATSVGEVALFTSPASAGEVARSAGEGAGPSPQPSPATAGEGARPSPQPSPATAGEGARPGILVCNDARMNEVYWGAYRFDAADPFTPQLLAPETVSPHDRVEVVSGVTLFAGNGIPRYPALQARLEAAGLRYVQDIYPRADAIAQLGARVLQQGDGVDAAHAIPVYIRDNVARAAQPSVT
jgi:tRNA threonylcarbamoyladenosine biosynthesis protein TsaB